MSQPSPIAYPEAREDQSIPLPQTLQDRLLAEVDLQGKVEEQQRKLAEARQLVAQAESASPLQVRLGRLLQRPEQDPQVLSAQAVVRKLTGEMTGLTQQGKTLDDEIDRMVDYYLYESVADYRDALARCKVLVAAENKAQGVRSTQKDLVAALGSARNMASSGYNKKTGEFSAAAGKLIQKSVLAAHKLIQGLGALGEELGGGASINPDLARLPERISALAKLPLSQMHKEIVDMISVCEKQIPDNLAACLGEAEKGAQARMAEVKEYRRRYIATLRRHARTMR